MAAVSESDRPGIHSVEIAGDILKALAEGGGRMALKDLAAACDLHRSKVHRYLISLMRAGLVEQDAGSGEYAIGARAITIGLVGLRRIDPVRIAHEALPGLRDSLNETIFLAIWGEMGATVIALEESVYPVTLNVRVGSILPLRTSAAGRVFNAYLPEVRIAEVLKREKAIARRDEIETLTDREFGTIAPEIREDGIAIIRGTLIAGVNALAVPVFDHREELVAVIGVVGRQETLSADPGGDAAELLKGAAAELSGRLGYLSPSVAAE